jgi:hypothetical protein
VLDGRQRKLVVASSEGQVFVLNCLNGAIMKVLF